VHNSYGQQLGDFGVVTHSIPLLWENTSALNMTKNQIVKKGNISMQFCKTEDQVVDILMKALSRDLFKKKTK